jgi:tetratricopeptide (TPR) repeat protein
MSKWMIAVFRPIAFSLLSISVITSGLAAQTAVAADSAWRRGDRDEARRLYVARLVDHPTDATALFRLAQLCGWEQRHRESIVWLDRLLSIHPEDREARVARARSIAALGDLTAARAIVDSVLDGHPGDVGALQTRARFMAWGGDLAGSERTWRHALALDDRNAETITGLAQAMRWQGRLAEAWQTIEPVLRADPANGDARVEADWIAGAFRPRIRSGVVTEHDSDGNLVSSLSAGAAGRPIDRIEVHADFWLRDAVLRAAAERSLVAKGGLMGVRWEAPAGWTFDGAVGLSSSGDGQSSRTALSAAATTPRRNRAVLNVALTRTPFDYTVPLVENGVTVDEAAVRLDYRADRDWTFAAALGIARFDVARIDSTSRRTSTQLAVTRRISDPFSLVVGLRTFGFDRDLAGGFFDPDFYGIADATLEWRKEVRRWALEADAAPGVQEIGGGGALSGALRAAASASWSVRPGRRIVLRAVWANTGLQPLSTDAGGSYRYRSISLSTNWWF